MAKTKTINIEGIDSNLFENLKKIQAKLTIEGKPSTQKDAIEFVLDNYEKLFKK